MAAFADRGYREDGCRGSARAGAAWRRRPPLLPLRPATCWPKWTPPWQRFRREPGGEPGAPAAARHRILPRFGGRRRGSGLLLVGPKGSGKTTLSLALGARGWNFLGDETGRRATADRRTGPGPPQRDDEAGPGGLRGYATRPGGRPIPREAFPDGSVRLRVPAQPAVPRRTAGQARCSLRRSVFLAGSPRQPRLERVRPPGPSWPGSPRWAAVSMGLPPPDRPCGSRP